jgi:outer membrane protein
MNGRIITSEGEEPEMRCKRLIVGFSVLVFLCFGMMGSSLFAQEEEEVLTLSESIAMALEKNWTLRAKEEGVRQANAVKDQSRADFFPTLSTTYGYTGYKDDLMRLGEFTFQRSKDNYSWRTNLSLPIFTGFALSSAYELSKLGVDQAEVEVGLEELDLALRVKQAYFNILIADKAVDVAEKDVASRKSNADVARNFYEVGMIPVNDLLQAEVEWADAQQTLVKVQNSARLARSAFNVILAREVNAPVEVEDILEYRPAVGEFGDFVERALEQRPEIKAVEIAILQADQRIRLAKSGHYPTVTISGEYVKQGDSFDVSGSPYHIPRDLSAGVTLSWTLFQGGKTYYSTRENESVKRELMETKRALEDSITLELKTALLDLETSEKNIPTTRQAVEQGEENLRVSEERYKAQVTTITEVLDAQTRLSQARVNYYRAFYDHNLAKARLLRAIGEY